MGEVINMQAKALDASIAYLERVGMTVLERDWRTGKDHVDLIAFDHGDIVLCDLFVRTGYQTPAKDVTPSVAKQRSLLKVAAAYIEEQSLIENLTVRYDIITLIVLDEGKALLRHHNGAVIVQETMPC